MVPTIISKHQMSLVALHFEYQIPFQYRTAPADQVTSLIPTASARSTSFNAKEAVDNGEVQWLDIYPEVFI